MSIAHIAIIENHIISTNTVRRKLVEALMSYGFKVTVLSTGSEDELKVAKDFNFEVVNVGTSNTNPLHVFQYLNTLRKHLKLINADICLTYTMRPAIWGNMATRSLGIPTITNITGTGPLADSKKVAYRVARNMYRVILRKTAAVFFQNKDDLQIFLDNGYVRKGQTSIIPGSGVDTTFFSPREKITDKNKFVFLFISRLIKDKGTLEFVGAAKALKEKYPQVVCRIVGPFWSQNLKENIISRGQIDAWVAEGIFEYEGPANDVRPHIAEADCIVMPSYREGMSNVLLEASSMQKPCIASNVTGCKNIVEDGITGFLCKARSTDSLATAMEKMVDLTEDERTAMGYAARQRVITFFEKKIVIDAYLDKINELLPKTFTV